MSKPVSPARVAIAAKILDNADDLATACRLEGVPFGVACALVEQESGGKNIYGHDAGGALSTNGRSITVCGQTYGSGSQIPVTPANAAIFLIKIAAGETSNGMGPCQITWAGNLADGKSGGYFRQMLEAGLLPWVPLDNMRFGLRLLAAQYKAAGTWELAFGHYNGGSHPNMQYAASAMALLAAWRKRFNA